MHMVRDFVVFMIRGNVMSCGMGCNVVERLPPLCKHVPDALPPFPWINAERADVHPLHIARKAQLDSNPPLSNDAATLPHPLTTWANTKIVKQHMHEVAVATAGNTIARKAVATAALLQRYCIDAATARALSSGCHRWKTQLRAKRSPPLPYYSDIA